MRKTNSILLLVFITLFVVILVEIYYYFQQQNTKSPVKLLSKQTIEDRLFYDDFYKLTRDSLLKSGANMLFPYETVNFYQGEVIDIQKSKGNVEKHGYKLDFKILIKGEGGKTIAFYFWEDAFPAIKTVIKEDGKETPIKIEDITKGDLVVIQDTRKLSSPIDRNIKEFKIIKL